MSLGIATVSCKFTMHSLLKDRLQWMNKAGIPISEQTPKPSIMLNNTHSVTMDYLQLKPPITWYESRVVTGQQLASAFTTKF